MNKRLERGLRILILLQSEVKYDALKLARELNVTRRTIFRDVAMLKELGLTIQYDVARSTYCVQVPDEASLGNRSLDATELSRVLQESLAEKDPTTSATRSVVEQIAMNLALSKVVVDRSRNPNDDFVKNTELESAVVGDLATAAPEIGADVRKHRFDKPMQKVCFAIHAIESERELMIWDQSEKKTRCVVASEIRYAANGWTLVATTKLGVVMNLPLGRLDFVCTDEAVD